jgi:hypothetical protein
MAGMHTLEERGQFRPHIAASKRAELANIAQSAQVTDADAARAAEEVAETARQIAQEAGEWYGVVEGIQVGATSLASGVVNSLKAMVGATPKAETPPTTDAQRESLRTLRRAFEEVAKEVDEGKVPVPMGAGGDETGADFERISDALEQGEKAAKAVMQAFPPESATAFRMQFLLEQLRNSKNPIDLAIGKEDVKLRGARGEEVPGYLAMNALLATPRIDDLREQVKQAVSKSVRTSTLAGKTMSTQELSRLQNTAQVAHLMGEFLSARDFVFREYRPQVGDHTAFLNETLQRRWKTLLQAANIKGELAEQFASMPDNALQMRLYKNGLLDTVRDQSDVLYKYLVSQEGASLRAVYDTMPADQTPLLEKFNNKLTAYKVRVSEAALAGLDDWDKVRVLNMRKDWKAIANRTGTDRFLKAMGDWATSITKGVVSMSFKVGKAFALRVGTNTVIQLAGAFSGGPVGMVGAIAIPSIVQALWGKYTGQSTSLRGLMTGLLTNAFFQSNQLLGDLPSGNFRQNGLLVMKSSLKASQDLIRNVAVAEDRNSFFDALVPMTRQLGFFGSLAAGIGASGGLAALGALTSPFQAVMFLTTAVPTMYGFSQNWKAGGDVPAMTYIANMLAQMRNPARSNEYLAQLGELEQLPPEERRAAYTQISGTGTFSSERQRAPQTVFQPGIPGGAVPDYRKGFFEAVSDATVGREAPVSPAKGYSIYEDTSLGHVPLQMEQHKGAAFTGGAWVQEKEGQPIAPDLQKLKHFDPVTRLMAGILSSDTASAVGQMFTDMQGAKALGLGATDFLNPDVPLHIKGASLGWDLLSNSGEIFQSLQQGKLEIMENLRDIQGFDLDQVYFDHVSQVSRWKADTKLRDLNARRRLKPPKTRGFLSRTQKALDKRTGEGLKRPQ